MANHTLTPANFNAIRDHIYDRIHKNGQMVKNDLPNLLRKAIEVEVWKQFNHPDGRPFANLVDWLVCTFPYGTNLGGFKTSLSYEDILKLTENVPEVHRVLAEHAPGKGTPGRKKQDTNGIASSTTQFNRHSPNRKTTLTARLAQEKPEAYDAYLAGEHKSITAAAIAAGLRKNNGNMRRAKSAFRKMTPEERKEFLAWTRTANARGN